jgi:uncharacterized protein YdiU (UPF0061 family)
VETASDERLTSQLASQEAATDWLSRWRQRLAAEKRDDEERRTAMLGINPLYIPRNHLVEEAIQHGLKGDFSTFETLLEAITEPFVERPHLERLTYPPEPDEVVKATF